MKSPRVKYYRARPSPNNILQSISVINIHAGAYGSRVRCVFDRQPCGFSLDSCGIPLSGDFPLHSRRGSITVRGIPISQPNEVSLLFLVFFLRPVFLPVALAVQKRINFRSPMIRRSSKWIGRRDQCCSSVNPRANDVAEGC